MKMQCRILLVSFVTLCSLQAQAAVISWTDWISSDSGTSAMGELDVDGTTVDIEFSATAPYSFIQTGTGINYWTGSAYTMGDVDNAPTPSELIALNAGSTVTLTFSEAIEDIYIAMNSWNGNVVEFDTDIVIDSFGPGYWGSGSATPDGDGDGFTGVGEFHGVILAEGAFTSISFTHTSENWHGFTLGVAALAEPSADVPAPATLGLFAGLLVMLVRRKLR